MIPQARTVRGTKVIGWLLGLLGAWLLLVMAAIWFGSGLIMKPPWYDPRTPEQGLRPPDDTMRRAWAPGLNDPHTDFGIDYQDVEFPARDGSTLRGWWVPGAEGATVGIVTVHGAGADRRDFLRHLPMLRSGGYPVLLFDEREHGISDGSGRGISLGIRESHDVSSAVAFAKDIKGLARIVVLGTSQGGASVILAGARDARIDAVISENPFARIEDLLQDTAMMRDVPGQLRGPMIRLALWRMGSRPRDGPIDHVAAIAPRPLFILHGRSDRAIPFEHSERIHAASAHPAAELWLPEGAGHAAIIDRWPDEYARRVKGFIRTALGSALGDRTE